MYMYMYESKLEPSEPSLLVTFVGFENLKLVVRVGASGDVDHVQNRRVRLSLLQQHVCLLCQTCTHADDVSANVTVCAHNNDNVIKCASPTS